MDRKNVRVRVLIPESEDGIYFKGDIVVGTLYEDGSFYVGPVGGKGRESFRKGEIEELLDETDVKMAFSDVVKLELPAAAIRGLEFYEKELKRQRDVEAGSPHYKRPYVLDAIDAERTAVRDTIHMATTGLLVPKKEVPESIPTREKYND